MFDGVREEQEHLREPYEEHIAKVLWLADKQWKHCAPFLFADHRHQVGMLRAIIAEIRTPLMLFVEQDTPLYTSETIDWDACTGWVGSGKADVVRFYHESQPPKEHSHLMGEWDSGFQRTTQFSARPHLASVDYYKRILVEEFSPHANCFIEDVMHSACQCSPERHKLWIYAPEGTWLRSYHLDGRAGDDKFDTTQVF